MSQNVEGKMQCIASKQSSVTCIFCFIEVYIMPRRLLDKSVSNKKDNNPTGEVSVLQERSPIKLFEIVLNFVADNIAAVQHFDGIPELIGEIIFNRTVERCPLLLTANVLTLFVSAYGEAVASSVNLSKCNLNAFVPKLVAVLPYLTALDLSYCGNDDRIAHPLGNLHLPRLERLSLEYNNMDDHCLRCLTMPATMFGRGAVNLIELSLAGNPNLTVDGLRHLTCFLKLKRLQLSWLFNTSIRNLASHLKMEVATHESTKFMVETLGWAKTLFCISSEVDEPSAEDAKRFYGHQRKQKQGGTTYSKQLVLQKIDFSKSHLERPRPCQQMTHASMALGINDCLMTSYMQYLPTSTKKDLNKHKNDLFE